MRFARVSRRMQEMVYDDTRWVHRLRLMGVWNEAEARKRFEEAMKRKRATMAAKIAEEAKKAAEMGVALPSASSGAGGVSANRTSTLFDAGEEENRVKLQREADRRRAQARPLSDGFDTLSITPLTAAPLKASIRDPASLLTVLPSVKSVRGFARQEYGRVYGALAPLYFDLAKAKTHTDPVVFRIFRDPEQQAQVLAQLKVFAQSDTAYGWGERLERLNLMTGIFENAALREFEGFVFLNHHLSLVHLGLYLAVATSPAT